MHNDSANSIAGRGLPAGGWTSPVSGVWGRGPSVLHYTSFILPKIPPVCVSNKNSPKSLMILILK